MKRTLLSFVLISISIFISQTVQSQISNLGFETWTQTNLFENPDTFTTYNVQTYFSTFSANTTKISGHSGNYAARLETISNGTDTIPGVLMLGNIGSNGFIRYPFSGQADSIKVWLRYNVMPGDTAFIAWLPSKLGFPLAFDIIPITGSQSTFTQFTFAFTHTPVAPDSVLLVFTSSNFDSPVQGSWLEVDNIELPGSNQQIPNAGLEHWSNFSYEDPSDWWTTNLFQVLGGQSPSIVKTTDAHSGNFALSLTSGTIDAFGGDTLTLLTNGSFGINGPEGGDAYSDRPVKLSGYYKYTPVANDSALVLMRLSKWNTANNMQDSIGGVVATLGPASSYTKFSLDIGYNLSYNPDTVILAFAASDYIDINNIYHPGSELILDDLAFEFPNGVSLPVKEALSGTIVYPNPSTGTLYIDLSGKGDASSDIRLYNLIGKDMTNQVISNYDMAKNRYLLNIESLESGIYIYIIQENGKTHSGKFTKQ